MSSVTTKPRGVMRTRRSASLALALSAAFVLSACGGAADAGSDGAQALPVLSGSNGDPSNGPSGGVIGSTQMAEGWDKEAGYNLKWDVANGSTVSMQLVANGKNQLAQASAPAIFAAAKLDPSLRIVGFLNAPSYLFVVPENSPIKSAADLKGKTVGVVALGSATHMLGIGAIKEAGLTEKDVKFLPVGVGAPMVEALNSGKIDALIGWEGMWQSISDLTDVPLTRLTTALTDLQGHMAIVSSEQEITKNRDVIKSFMKNFYRGCVLGVTDPEQVVRNHWEIFPNVKPPANQYEEMVKKQAAWNLDFYKTCTEPSRETGMMGVLSKDEIKEAYDFFRANNVVEDDIDLDQVIDLSMTEEVMQENTFDDFKASLN